MMQKHQFLFFFSTLCILFLSVSQIQAQTKPVIGLKQQIKSAAVDQEMQAYEIYQFDAAPVHTDLLSKGGLGNLVLELGNHHWNIILEPSNVMAENYQLRVQTDKGIEVFGKTYEKAFKGTELQMGGNVRMTLDHGYLSGFVQEGKKRYFIEPLYQYDLNAAKNLFVVYEASDVIENHNATCTEHHAPQERGSGDIHIVQEDQSSNKQQICLDLQLAIASDKSMFTKYGSVTAVENHNITVINNVEVNYTGVFIHDINYVIVTQFVVTGTDPWSNTLTAGDLLDEFTAWGPGNFGTTHDLGELWTNRDFTGSTIGIAWVSALCTSFKYHALQDFSTNQQSLRVMTAH